ncbi:thiamine ABC transporter permease [Citrobacter sp. FP75]|uniref:thiamine ABC transporter permease n=1 Tax=Citrobacter sp. FP75 TaxID=1852949 RepID=UPI001BC942C8|nr:thiamine ABC transporter permease [Citrobacter sp. FP75]
MATPLRYALILLLWGIMAVIYLPLIPAAVTLVAPALSLSHWQALFADPQLPQSLMATLVSVTLASLGALIITLLAILALWPGAGWARLCTRLPWLLAIPHVAFATSILLLFAEGGLLYRVLPFLTPLADRYGIGLGMTLAVKESAFLLWILSALLSEKHLSQQVIVLDSLGYSRLQCLNWLVLPSVAPALSKAMLAVIAWSLSVVDVAIVLGPGNPPTLAVLSWQWLTQGDADQQIKGSLASLLLVLLLGVYALVGYLLWRTWQRTISAVSGDRLRFSSYPTGRALAQLVPASGVFCLLVLALVAQYSSVDRQTLFTSLQLGLLASTLALITLLLWLEWGPQRRHHWVWLPIILPALPLVTGQYTLALHADLDGQLTTVIWGHLLWVTPWMLFVLKPAWQRIDPRLILIAQTLGWTRGRIFWQVKCPQLTRPALIAFAVGFSVSIAQYMPTLWLGAGRFPTLTTEAVALSSGGSAALLASQALWQLLLPLFVFVLSALLSAWVGRFRQGLR